MIKKAKQRNMGISIAIALAILFSILAANSSSQSQSESLDMRIEAHSNDTPIDLQEEALSILQLKCNTCHKKRNPFMVFTLKNMERRAEKIKKQVFELKRMPQPGTTLSPEEYSTLKNWLDAI